MTISEIGLLRLKPSASLEDPGIRKRLADIQSHLSSFTGHQFHYFRQVEDPALLYLLGQWESLESHYKSMHGSEEWKKGVMEMSNYFAFQWMAHYGFGLDSLRSDDMLEVHRFLMKTGSREEFDRQLRVVLGEVAGEEGRVIGGWKMDGKEGDEEYAAVLAVDDAEKRSGLSKRYDDLGQFAGSVDRHLIRKFI